MANFSFSGAGTGTVAPIGVNSSGQMGGATATGLRRKPPSIFAGGYIPQSDFTAAGLPTNGIKAASPGSSVSSNTLPNSQKSKVPVQPYANANVAGGFNQPGGTNALGTHILTQQELDAQNAARGITQKNTAQPGGTNALGTAATSGNSGTNNSGTTFGGLVGGLMTQAKQYQQQQAGLTQQAQDVTAKFAGLEGNLANSPLGGGANGIGSARLAQLENLKQNTVGAIESEQAKLAGYQTPITTAYGTAIGAAAPKGRFPFVFYPLTGQFSNAAGTQAGAGNAPTLTYNPQQDATTLAQLVISGKIPYSDAVSAMGYAKDVGPGLLQTAITSQGGDLTKIQAQTAATQSNIQTGGTAATNTAASGFQSAAQNYQTNLGLSKAASGQAQNVTNLLSSLGINQGVPAYNKAINQLQTQLGSTAFTKLNTSIAELQNMYSNVLNSSGMTPTTSESQALSLLNPNSTASQINATIQQLDTAIYNRQQGLYSILQGFSQNLGQGGQTQNGTNSTTNQSTNQPSGWL